MRIAIARGASILGHPLLLMPAAALAAASMRSASAQLAPLALVLGALVCAALVFSVWCVWSGRWSHIDASNRGERRSLNWFLALALFGTSLIAWRMFPTHELAYGLAVSGISVVVVLLALPVLKLSLHTCFAAMAAGLLWPSPVFIAIGLVIVIALGWSRVVLRRHTLAEVVMGVLVGTLSVIGYHALAG